MTSYVDAAIDAMDRGLNADSTEWKMARSKAIGKLHGDVAIPNTYSDLARLVRIAGGPHSKFVTPDQARLDARSFGPETAFPLPMVEVDAGIGRLTVPSFGSDDASSNLKYTQAANTAILNSRGDVSCGWIVDLRDNSGGDAFEMLAAVSPLLDDGLVMRMRDRNGADQDIVIAGNDVLVDGERAAGVSGGRVKIRNLPVAILQSRSTASAAEAVVVAFHGQSRSVSFGQGTAGYSSGNLATTLSDGARLLVTESVFVDRAGTVYGNRIAPDRPTRSVSQGPTDVQVAKDWLKAQCA